MTGYDISLLKIFLYVQFARQIDPINMSVILIDDQSAKRYFRKRKSHLFSTGTIFLITHTKIYSQWIDLVIWSLLLRETSNVMGRVRRRQWWCCQGGCRLCSDLSRHQSSPRAPSCRTPRQTRDLSTCLWNALNYGEWFCTCWSQIIYITFTWTVLDQTVLILLFFKKEIKWNVYSKFKKQN